MSIPARLLLLVPMIACASGAGPGTRTVDPRPPVLGRPARSPPDDPLASPRRARDGGLWVLPIEVAAGAAGVVDPADADRALALSQLLVNAAFEHPDLDVLGLTLAADGGPLGPARLAATRARYLVGGRLTRHAASADDASGGYELALWLVDREARFVVSRSLALDPPRLMAPRLALADLFAEVGRGPDERVRADMTYYEDLDLAGLALAGELVRARRSLGEKRSRPALDALVARADAALPWSHLASAEVAEHLVLADGRCSGDNVDRLARVLALRREVPPGLATFARSCTLAAERDADAPAIPAWSIRSGAHCRVGAKALTAIASTRGSPTGRREPGSGFVTGLGGLYRGDTCEASYAVRFRSSEELGPPIVQATLELEAAFYFYANRDRDKSTRWFRRAQATARAAPEQHCLVRLLGAEAALGLADLAIEDGRHADASALLPEARAVAEACADRRMLGRTLNSEALLEQGRSAFDRSLERLERAREVFARIGDTMNLAVVETNLGVTWLHLGRVERAMPHLEAALAGKRKVRSEGGVGVLLENLGVAELARGDARAASTWFSQALPFAKEAHTVATLQVQLARLALVRGDLDTARAHMDRAREASLSTHSRVLDAIIEQTDAAVSVEAGAYASALSDFHDALVLRRAIGDRAGEGITLSLLMAVCDRMGEPALAILYGKLAVQAHQEVRGAARNVDAETHREFLASRAETYRHLAELLVREGRLIEAERVLALLKEDEVSQWTRDAAAVPRDGVPLTVAERAIDERYRACADEVMALGKEHGELAAKWPRTPAQERRLEALRVAIEGANARFLELLASLAGQGTTLAHGRALEELREGTGIGPDLAELGPGVVAVYTLVGEDAYHAIVVSADAQVARSAPIGEAHINALVAALRETLQDPTRDPRPAARALYDVLIAPIAADLAQAGARQVLWSLDRTLRYVPIGALYDGQRFALERWAMAVFTPASKARLKDEPSQDWRVLALGVTAEHPPFPALPAVADELAGLVDLPETAEHEGVLPGLKALDGDFTRDLLLAQLTRRWPVVHLASHFAFQPGDKDQTYLLLGDGSRLTAGELERLPNLFAGVDLLTLSACNTATGDLAGDGAEVESFAVLAQRKGARAVFASLWPVADQSTSALMRRFYALHGKGKGKLEALREAQLELLSGKLAASSGAVRARPLLAPGAAPPSVPLDRAIAGWRHPYHWAPFVLVGNVR